MTKETTGANKPDMQKDLGPSKSRPGTESKEREKKSQLEGPAAYAPHDDSEKSNRCIHQVGLEVGEDIKRRRATN